MRHCSSLPPISFGWTW